MSGRIKPSGAPIASMNQMTAKAKMELVSFLQPFFHSRKGGPGGPTIPSPVWYYVTPIAPATAPSHGPPSPPFQNGITNVAGKQAVSFRLWPATKVQLRGALDLHGASLPVTVFTLPPGYRPPNTVAIDFPSISSQTLYTGRVDTNGDVSVTGIVAGAGVGGIAFDTNPQAGDWLFTSTSTDGGPNGYGTQFDSTGGIALTDNSADGIFAHQRGGGGIEIRDSGAGGLFLHADNAGGVAVRSTGGSGQMQILCTGSGGTNIQDTGGGGVTVDGGAGGVFLQVSSGGFVTLIGLPTSTPGGTGRVWNNLGILSIT